MGCPKCQCEEISDSGVCLWCGYQVRPPAKKSGLESPSADQGKQDDEENLKDAKEVLDDAGAAGASVFQEAEAEPQEEFVRETYIREKAEGRSILLPRSLAGLVDLAIIALSAGLLVLAAAFFSEISTPDLWSILLFSILFILIFFLYSLVFLGFSNQTIGMMITNLQVVAETGQRRLKTGQAFMRCCCYLVSLFCLGIGLVWAFFDRRNRCLHDKLTNTQVVHIYDTNIRQSI
jgi:uncharacterized RDD family membrane protein YckC